LLWLYGPEKFPGLSRNGPLGGFPFNQKFRTFQNEQKWFGNFPGKVPENPRVVEFPKGKPINRKFREENKMERKFRGKKFENLGIPREVVLFLGNYVNSQLPVQR